MRLPHLLSRVPRCLITATDLVLITATHYFADLEVASKIPKSCIRLLQKQKTSKTSIYFSFSLEKRLKGAFNRQCHRESIGND